MDFDPCAVSRMNEKKTVVPGSPASSLLSELRLRSIIENARQMCKVKAPTSSLSNLIYNIACVEVTIFLFLIFSSESKGSC